jgi:hypothetical protein
MLGPMSYPEFKRTIETYQNIADKYSAILQSFPRGDMGLTPDAVKFSPEFQAAKQAYDRAARAIRDLNGTYAKSFAKEIRADIEARRAARRSTIA